jgi:hypothetical protein
MKQLLLATAALLLLFSCKKEDSPIPQVENPDWYVLRSPDNRDIKAVHGNIDDTLTITTGFDVFVTTDKGKTWTKGNYNARVGLFAFMEKQDTLYVMESRRSGASVFDNQFGMQPNWFSTDHGLRWERSTARWDIEDYKVPINYAFSGNGIRFQIDLIQTEEGYLHTIGIKSENGQKIKLPARHQLASLYFDTKSRLYVAGSAPLCGQGNTFEYCDQVNRSGTVYVSKHPILF